MWVSHDNLGLSYSLPIDNQFTSSQNIDVDLILLLENDKVILVSDTGIFNISDTKNNYIISDFKNIHSVAAISENSFFLSESDKVFFMDKEKTQLLDNHSVDFQYSKHIENIYPQRTLITTTSGIKEIHQDTTGEYFIGECKEFKDYPTFSFIQIHQSYHSLKTYVPYNATDLWVYQATPDSLRLIKKIKAGLEFFGFTDSQKEPGTIWAGSAKGLVKITQDTVITRLSDVDGKLKNVAVYSVIEDKKGVLWLGTNSGLFQYFPDTGKTFQYEEEDGLPSNTFSLLNSAIMTDEGEIWMGTNKGVVRFNPEEVKPYSTAPNVYIDGLLINDTEPVKGIGEKDSLHLTYEENTLLFDVKAIGYYKAKRNKINYRMQGYEEDWISIKNGQMIRYAKLPPGKYTLQVQSEDVNGNPSERKELHIFVQPPFWQTTWFYLLLTFSALCAAYAFYRYRIGLIRKEEEQKTALAKLNLQVLETEMKALKAQMNPHFLFNSMNSIKGLILKQESKKASVYLTKFSTLLRSILANSEKKYVLLSQELEALKLYTDLEALRFTSDFACNFEIDPTIDADFLRIPPLVIQPFVENAVWHGLLPKKEGEKKLWIRIIRQEDFILCTVQDNGVGRRAVPNTKPKSNHKSMGIGITRKRIELIHPENEIQITDLLNEQGSPSGTKVQIYLHAPE